MHDPSRPPTRRGAQRLLLFVLVGAASLLGACTYTVDSTLDAPDANPGDFRCARAVRPGSPRIGLCTLRAAIMESNATVLRERIEVPTGVYSLTLPIAEGGGALEVTSGVSIRGAGSGMTVIDAGGGCSSPLSGHGVFFIDAPGGVRISELTVRGGGNVQEGGGIYATATNLVLEDVVLQDNFGFTGGGGLRVRGGSTATVRRSSILENCAQGAFGGGVWNSSELFVHDSTIAGNVSNRAGGIRNTGTLNLRNTTVSGNTVDSPQAGVGGISQVGFAFLNNVTVTGNVGQGNFEDSFRGGGIQTSAGATTVMRNSIVAGNDGAGGPNDCVGPLTSDSRYNLIGDSEGCEFDGSTETFLLDVDPLLLPLADNGGATDTHALDPGSPALDVGYEFPPPAVNACEARDQRGVPRPQGAGVCDLGAYERTSAGFFVTGFVLVDAGANVDLRPLRNGELLNLGRLPPQLSVRAVVPGAAPGSVVFDFDDVSGFQTENAAPYALDGDAPAGDYIPVPLSGGPHEIRATPFAAANGGGAAGGSLSVSFWVIGSN